MDLSYTVAPKSDQLNADDLIAGSITIRVAEVKETGSPDQPIAIHYSNDNGRPYKPGKSMRRVLISAWGSNGHDWVGKSMTLYNDPAVRFGGQAVGGIRISHLSHIDKDMNLLLTTTRAKRAPYQVKKLSVMTEYPADKFNEQLPQMLTAIESGKSTLDDIIAYLEKTAPLTNEQRAALSAAQTTTEEEDLY